MDLESQLPTNQFDKEMAEWAEKPLPERIARILLCCVLSVIALFVALLVFGALEGDGHHTGVYSKQSNYVNIPKCEHFPYNSGTPDANRNDNQLDYESEETNIDFNAPKDLGIATGDDIDEREFKQDASDLESRYLADPDVDVTATKLSIFEDDPRIVRDD
eukprot:1044435_1